MSSDWALRVGISTRSTAVAHGPRRRMFRNGCFVSTWWHQSFLLLLWFAVVVCCCCRLVSVEKNYYCLCFLDLYNAHVLNAFESCLFSRRARESDLNQRAPIAWISSGFIRWLIDCCLDSFHSMIDSIHSRSNPRSKIKRNPNYDWLDWLDSTRLNS